MKERYLRMVRQAYRLLKHKRMRHRPWWRAMTKPLFHRALWIPCRDTVATGLMIGLFFSMIVILPFQMLFAAVFTMRLKANVPIAMAACWISNLFTIPPIAIGQAWLGDWMRRSLHVPMPNFLTKVQFGIPEIGQVNAASFFLGMMVSAVIVSLLSYPLVHIFSKFLPQHLPVRKSKVQMKNLG